jgi:hypothetical protein
MPAHPTKALLQATAHANFYHHGTLAELKPGLVLYLCFAAGRSTGQDWEMTLTRKHEDPTEPARLRFEQPGNARGSLALRAVLPGLLYECTRPGTWWTLLNVTP